MIPKKLFTPKCLHIDRDTVFREDLQNFFNHILSKSYFKIDSNLQNNLLTNEQLFNYSIFKKFWIEKKMSMLHFSKSKEENFKEYYEVLYGEVQAFIFKDDIFKALSIFSLYSLYYTQTNDHFYQINTIPEVINQINNFLHDLQLKYFPVNNKLLKELAMMINKLYKDEAFSIGTILGLKTIILNKYGLPIEQKQKVYKEYTDIDQTLKQLEKSKVLEKEKIILYENEFEDYKEVKRQTVNLIKDLGDDAGLGKLYCDFLNNKLNVLDSGINLYSFPHQNIFSSLSNNFDLMQLSNNDFNINKITNLDLQFNQVDNNLINKY